YPPPAFFFQTSLGPLSGQEVNRPVSRDTPSRRGPRHWGQSKAAASAALPAAGLARGSAGLSGLSPWPRAGNLSHATATLTGKPGRGKVASATPSGPAAPFKSALLISWFFGPLSSSSSSRRAAWNLSNCFWFFSSLSPKK